MQVTGIFPTPIYGAVDIKQITIRKCFSQNDFILLNKIKKNLKYQVIQEPL